MIKSDKPLDVESHYVTINTQLIILSVDIADVVPKMTERIMTTKRSISRKFCVIKEDQEFAPTVIPTSTLDLCFDRCSYEEQVRICSRTFYIDYVAFNRVLYQTNTTRPGYSTISTLY